MTDRDDEGHVRRVDPLTGASATGERLHAAETEVKLLWRWMHKMTRAHSALATRLERAEKMMSNTAQDVDTLNTELTTESTDIDALTTSVNTFIQACDAMPNKPTDLTAALATVKADLAKLGALQGTVTAATPAPVPTPPPTPAPAPSTPAPTTPAPSAGTTPAPSTPTDGGTPAPAPTPPAS